MEPISSPFVTRAVLPETLKQGSRSGTHGAALTRPPLRRRWTVQRCWRFQGQPPAKHRRTEARVRGNLANAMPPVNQKQQGACRDVAGARSAIRVPEPMQGAGAISATCGRDAEFSEQGNSSCGRAKRQHVAGPPATGANTCGHDSLPSARGSRMASPRFHAARRTFPTLQSPCGSGVRRPLFRLDSSGAIAAFSAPHTLRRRTVASGRAGKAPTPTASYAPQSRRHAFETRDDHGGEGIEPAR